MDLQPGLGHRDAGIGAEGLGDRRQQRRPRQPVGVPGRPPHVDGHGTGERDGAGGEDLGLHLGQHPAHVGMLDDRPAPDRRAALPAVLRIGQRVLIGRPRPRRSPCTPTPRRALFIMVNIAAMPVVLRADQPAGGAVVVHHRGGRAVQAQLVLEADDLERVPPAGIAVGIGEELRHQEQADPLGPRRAVRQPGEHEVADVVGKVVVGPGDEDLLAGDRIGPVAVRLGLGAQRADVGSGLRLGQVHRAAPVAGDQLGQVECLAARRLGMMFQRLDLALGHQRVELQRQAGAGHHVVDGGWSAPSAGPCRRSPAAPTMPIQPPSAIARVAIGEARRGPHHAVFEPRGMQVARAVQRGQHLRRTASRPRSGSRR